MNRGDEPAEADSSGSPAGGIPAPGRDLGDEAMYRRIAGNLFGDDVTPVAIDRFTIHEVLGTGGMGVVYAAHDPRLARVVALKLIRDRSGDDGRTRSGERTRLIREAQALARLSHPNVVQVYEVGEAAEGVFVVMERIVGRTLGAWLALRRRGRDEILAVFAQAARGLAAAHEAGLVHGDFKPANVLVGDSGRVHIVDFGLARAVIHDPTVTSAGQAVAGEGRTHSQSDRAIAGTPAYMAPEQLRGVHVDARSDVFAFCVALFEALHGVRPFTPEALLDGSARTPPGAARRLPRWLRRVMARGLAVDPGLRSDSMADLARTLEVVPRRRRLVTAALVGLVALTGGVLVALTFAPAPARAPVCEDIAEVAVWGPEARHRLTRAFAASGLSFAGRSDERVRGRLDAYARAITAERREACAATLIRSERSPELMDRAMLCLERAERALGELVRVLGEGDRRTIAAADDLVAGLPPLAACRARAHLLAEPGAPETPESAAVDAELREAERLRLARRSAEALPVIARALAHAGELGDDRRSAAALLLRARIEGHILLDAQAATASLNDAHDAALRAGDLASMPAIYREFAFLGAHIHERVDLARVALRHAYAARREPADPLLDASLLHAEAIILRLEGRSEEAQATAEKELHLLAAAFPREHPERVIAALQRAYAIAVRDPRAAIVELDALLADARERLGVDHPSTAIIDAALAQLHAEGAAWELARRHGIRAQAILRGLHGEDHPVAASVDLALARADAASGDLDAALARAERARQIFERVYHRGASETIAALGLLAELDQATDRHAAALPVYLRLLELGDALGRDFDRRGVLINIGEALCRLGRCAEARPYFERTLALLGDADARVLRAFPLLGLARIAALRGEHAVALPLLEEALTRLDAAPEFSPATVAEVARELAVCLRGLGRAPARARALLRRAEAIERELSREK